MTKIQSSAKTFCHGQINCLQTVGKKLLLRNERHKICQVLTMGRLHLIRVPRNHYFRTRCRKISMIMTHFTEKHFKENPYFKGKKT